MANTGVHFKLANLVASEFFNQGDLEKEKFKQEPIVCISFLKYKCNFSFQINKLKYFI